MEYQFTQIQVGIICTESVLGSWASVISLFLEKSKFIFTNFKMYEKNSKKFNNVTYKHANFDCEILCIVYYTKIIKLDKDLEI
jgi:hypothetical protein